MAFSSLAALAALAVPPAASAAEVGLFRLDSRDEIVAGENDGTAIGPLGQIELGFALDKLAAFEEPFLLSAAPIPGGGFLVGTGNQGKVFKVDAGGQATLLDESPEGQVFSVLARRDGTLLAASSPKAKVYRYGAKGAEVVFDPGATYVWAMAEDAEGRLLVATGLPGRLYRVDAKGQGELLYEGAEPHLRSLLVLSGGDLLFGSAGQGLILRRSEKGGTPKVETLYDAAEPEVGSLTQAPDGRIFAALLASEASQVDLAAGEADASGAKPAPDGEAAVVGSRAAKATGPRSVVVELRGREARKLFELQDETVHSLLFAGGFLWAGSGQDGNLYRFKDEVLVREASLEEKQVVALAPQGEGLAVATTDSAALYRLPGARRTAGTYTSKPLDAKEVASFGLLRAEGRRPAGAGFAFEARSGATDTPDPTWTLWQNLPGAPGEGDSFSLAGVSPARYLQVRAKLERKGAEAPRLDAIEISYRQENRAPRIDKLEVLPPGEILVPAGFNPTTTTFEPWSPNKEGIFTSIKGEEEKGEGRTKSLYKKGYRTLRWSAADGNGDPLRYTLELQREGAPENEWVKVVDKLDDDHYSFDSTVLPDGRYRFRLRVADGLERASGGGLEAARVSELVQIDHSPPRVVSRQRAEDRNPDRRPAGGRIEVELEDASPLREVVYSVDGGDWQRLEALDGLLDGRRETVAPEVPAGARFVVVRVTDAAFNVLTFPLEPR